MYGYRLGYNLVQQGTLLNPLWAKIGDESYSTQNFALTETILGNAIREEQTETNVEKITESDDRTFDSDTGNWSKGLGWSIGGGNASRGAQAAASFIRFPNILVANELNRVRFSWTKSAGTIQMSYFNGSAYVNVFLNFVDSSGVEDLYFIPESTNGFLYFWAASGQTVVSIDNVSNETVGFSGLIDMYNGLIAQGTDEYTSLKTTAAWRNPDNDIELGVTYGKLYNQLAAKLFKDDINAFNQSNPELGYEIVTRADLVSISSVGGNAAKEKGTEHWNTANGTNTSKLKMLGSGYIDANGSFIELKDTALMICSDEHFARKVIDSDNSFLEVATTSEGGVIRLKKKVT